MQCRNADVRDDASPRGLSLRNATIMPEQVRRLLSNSWSAIGPSRPEIGQCYYAHHPRCSVQFDQFRDQFRATSTDVARGRQFGQSMWRFRPIPMPSTSFGAISTDFGHVRQICLDSTMCRTKMFSGRKCKSKVAGKLAHVSACQVSNHLGQSRPS